MKDRANLPCTIAQLMLVMSKPVSDLSGSNLSGQYGNSSIPTTVVGLRYLQAFVDAQHADNPSAFSKMVAALEVHKGLIFGGSHETKIQANRSAVGLQQWAQKADVETMEFTIENFVMDMEAVISHKRRTNRLEADKLQSLAKCAIESALDLAKQNIQQKTAVSGEELLRPEMEDRVEAALRTAQYHGFSTGVTLAFINRDDIKFN